MEMNRTLKWEKTITSIEDELKEDREAKEEEEVGEEELDNKKKSNTMIYQPTKDHKSVNYQNKMKKVKK